MENKQKKCIKGKSCLYCGTTYCQFVDELNELNSFKEQIKFQNNFIDSLLKATNNSEWLDKSILDDEASEIIEKIELDYSELDQLKAENDKLKRQHEGDKGLITSTGKMNYQLIQEYDKLKGKVKLYEEILQRNTQGFETGATASMFAEMVKGVGNSIRDEKLFKLKQTLTEIKEIAENVQSFVDSRLEDDVFTEMDKILQKISEVEDG